MKRRLLSIFCALCLCLTLLPTAALADGLKRQIRQQPSADGFGRCMKNAAG